MRTRSRRGTAYLLVLVTAMVAVAAGATGIMVQRARRDEIMRASDMERARQAAQSGIELATSFIQANASWRTTPGLGTWLNDAAMPGGGRATVTISDPDGNATDDELDPVTIVSEGAFGSARQVVSVRLQPRAVPMNSLAYASSAADATGFQATINANAPIATNGQMAALLANVRADVYAGGSIIGLTYARAKYPNSGTRQHPDPSTVFAWYIANGTNISVGSISGFKIEKTVIGPNRNPWGTPNPLGIYVIDCENKKVIISECRIEGTLVLLNPGAGTEVEKTVHWKPAVANLPALMVRGSIRINIDPGSLSESSANTNFNPTSAPYNGVADNDKLDTYPSRIEGLIYVSDDLTMQKASNINGQVLVGDDAAYEGNITFTRSTTYWDDPPIGFRAGYVMRTESETLARVWDD